MNDTPRGRSQISDLESLTVPARQAGIDVHTRVHLASALASPVQAAVYRIAQESITNVVRHSSAKTVHVDVRETAEGVLSVTISDDGDAPGPDQETARIGSLGGNGIAGMRERAQLLGGTLWAGRRDEGFVVQALIPLEAAQQ